nr:hypothetical protein [Tanacetum cinerariifolium]
IIEDPGLFTLPCRLWGSKPFDTLADLGSCVNIIPLYLFKKLNIRLLEESDHIFGLADGTKSYPVGIVKDVEVHIGKLKLLNDFYVINIKKDPETPLLIGRGFLATANVVIVCQMAKVAVGERITRSVFGVKGVDLGTREAPYWTTLRKRESYKPRPHSKGVGAQTPYYARKDFLDCHLPREWEISRDSKLNPFKDTLMFRRMVEILGVIPINLKCNMKFFIKSKIFVLTECGDDVLINMRRRHHDTCTRKSQPLSEGTATHPKDSGGNIQPLNRDLNFMNSDEVTAKTTSRPEGSLGDKDLRRNILPIDLEPIHPTVADLLRTGAKSLTTTAHQKPKNGKCQTVTPTLPKSQGPEAFEALSKKRQKPKSN